MSGRKLSQAEIDALINSVASEPAEPSPPPARRQRRRRSGPRPEVPGLDDRRERVESAVAVAVSGGISRVAGHELEVRGLRMSVGDLVSVATSTGNRVGEVVAIDEAVARVLVFDDVDGIGKNDRVVLHPGGHRVHVSADLLGRVIDAHGQPLDGRGPIRGTPVSLNEEIPPPLSRRRIDSPLPTGVRLLDGLCTAGRGQRIGLFGGSGVGKSTLLGMMARGTAADVTVVALIGERGREVREFIEDDLGPEGLARSVVIVATSDQPPLVRLRAAQVATRIGGWFADEGADVLLMLDSLTRLAHAQRDVGLAAGEPPTARGYTPSVFSMLPGLLERAGPRAIGTLTAFYTVLVDGDDMNDPIADAARGILDGHVILDRSVAIQGRYPAIDPLASLSRLQSKVLPPARVGDASALRAGLAAMAEVRDLIEVGAYVPGTNPPADAALAVRAEIEGFLAQGAHEPAPFEDTLTQMAALADRLRSGGAR